MEEKKDTITEAYETEKDQENQEIQTVEAGEGQNEGDKGAVNKAGGDSSDHDQAASEQSEGAEVSEEDEGDPYIKPEGEPLYETDVLIKASDLFDYSLRHTYTSLSGVISTIIGIFMIYVFFARNASALYLIFGIIVVGYIPVNLFLMSRQQAMHETFKNPLHYAFYKNGMEVSQGEIREMQEWSHIYKAISTSNSIIVYTGKNRASIFPRRDLQPDATALIQVICAHVDPKKVKIKQ